MRTFGITTVVMFSLMAFLGISWAAAPCKDKQEAKHAARKALHECIESWAKDGKPADADPSDDCSSKMSAFVEAAKTVKACRGEHQKDAKH